MADLELHGDQAAHEPVIEQQVHPEIFPANVDLVFLSDEGEMLSQLKDELFKVGNYGLLQVFFVILLFQSQEIKGIFILEMSRFVSVF